MIDILPILEDFQSYGCDVDRPLKNNEYDINKSRPVKLEDIFSSNKLIEFYIY